MNNDKKIIKVKFIDYWNSLKNDLEDYLIMQLLRKHYNVVVCDDADYVFFATMGESHWGIPDKCVKIFQTGENLVPDFNACDYAIGFEWMDYEDRYIRFPLYLFYNRSLLHEMEHKHELPDDWDLHKEKTEFCSFVVSNNRNPRRNLAFHELCKYKKVNSGGNYLNNIGGPVADKLSFEKKHKFSLCFENGAHNGYTTEKLVQAFAARTIPIYWGDPLVGKVFNPKAFIDASSYSSLEEVIQKVQELERDEEQYMAMLREPALLASSPSVDEEIAKFEDWLINIFEQPIEKAYRRNREMQGRWYVERRYKLDSWANRKQIWHLYKSHIKKCWKYIQRKINL